LERSDKKSQGFRREARVAPSGGLQEQKSLV
jgi:hypothetical protein